MSTQDASPIAPSDGGETPVKQLVLHHLENSRSQRILWLLEELEVPYTLKIYKRTSEKLAPPELKAVHPLGKSPLITDGELTLAESGAIVAYIISKYGRGRCSPPESGLTDDLYFSHFAEGSLTHLLQNLYIFTIIPERAPLLLRPLVRSIFGSVIAKLIQPQLEAAKKMIEDHLAKTSTLWFAGGDIPTSADFMMLFPLEAMQSRVPNVGPKIKAWVEMVHARPAYQRALEKGGKYDYA